MHVMLMNVMLTGCQELQLFVHQGDPVVADQIRAIVTHWHLNSHLLLHFSMSILTLSTAPTCSKTGSSRVITDQVQILSPPSIPTLSAITLSHHKLQLPQARASISISTAHLHSTILSQAQRMVHLEHLPRMAVRNTKAVSSISRPRILQFFDAKGWLKGVVISSTTPK